MPCMPWRMRWPASWYLWSHGGGGRQRNASRLPGARPKGARRQYTTEFDQQGSLCGIIETRETRGGRKTGSHQAHAEPENAGCCWRRSGKGFCPNSVRAIEFPVGLSKLLLQQVRVRGRAKLSSFASDSSVSFLCWSFFSVNMYSLVACPVKYRLFIRETRKGGGIGRETWCPAGWCSFSSCFSRFRGVALFSFTTSRVGYPRNVFVVVYFRESSEGRHWTDRWSNDGFHVNARG